MSDSINSNKSLSDSLRSIRDANSAHSVQLEYEKGAPRPGQKAPDFTLFDNNGKNPMTLSTQVKLGKPVALVFGSFTWPPFVESSLQVGDLYAKYSRDVEFFVIYTREAHPATGGWSLDDLAKYKPEKYESQSASLPRVSDPESIDERRLLARKCEAALEHNITMLVDEMDDRAMNSYRSWPEKLALIDEDQTLLYLSGMGPEGFIPSELAEAIEKWKKKKGKE